MKTVPGTRLIVTTAIGVACTATVLMFGTPTPTPTPKVPYQFTMRCIPATAYLGAAISCVPDEQKNIMINGTPVPNSNPLPVPTESDCEVDHKSYSNVTQRVAFQTSDALKKFLEKAFPAFPVPTPTPCH